MKIKTDQQNLTFNAKPIAQWCCKDFNNNIKNITVASFEKRDINFIQKLINNINSIYPKDSLKQELIRIALNTIKEILEKEDSSLNKVKMLIALHDGKPLGLLIGNIPKHNVDSKKVYYSSRHNCAKNETELDWLVTWQPNEKMKTKGVGKALVAEFFKTIKKDKFRDVFVRSEVPEKSFAEKFYESLGFEKIGNKRLKLFNKNSAQYSIKDYTDSDDDTIPMIITRKKLKETYEYLAQKMTRQEFIKKSVDANSLIKI